MKNIILFLLFQGWIMTIYGQKIKGQKVIVESLADTIQHASEIDKNVEMSDLYKQVNPLSTFAPAGEIGSGNSYLFTADVNPLFVFSNSLRRKLSFAIGMRVPVRMFTEDSYPIRTPSFIPSLRLYYNLHNDPMKYRFAWVGFTHHSNGQDGPSLINGEWNTKSGNFSTNWLTGSFEWGDNYGYKRKHWSVALLQHTEIGDLLAQDSALKNVYGQTRIDGSFQFRKVPLINVLQNGNVVKRYFKESSRLHIHLQWIVAGQKNIQSDKFARSFNIEGYYHYFPMFMKDGGFFVGGGYYGEDPYNIFFHKNYPFIKFGVSAGSLAFKLLE